MSCECVFYFFTNKTDSSTLVHILYFSHINIPSWKDENMFFLNPKLKRVIHISIQTLSCDQVHPVCSNYPWEVLELDWSPPVTNCIDWTQFRKVSLCVSLRQHSVQSSLNTFLNEHILSSANSNYFFWIRRTLIIIHVVVQHDLTSWCSCKPQRADGFVCVQPRSH